MAEPLAALKSSRGKDKVVDNGFVFIFDRYSSGGETKFWRCEKKDRCKARLHTDAVTGEVTLRIHEHTHQGSAAEVEVQRVRMAVKRRSIETQEKPSQIIAATVYGASMAAMGIMPTASALRKVVRRKREEADAPPPAPLRRADIVIPQRYREYEGDRTIENFLLLDSGVNDEFRILVFGREKILDNAAYFTTLYVDGTFKQAPPLFSQVFMILGEHLGYVFPLMYALLPDKSARTYGRLFGLIQGRFPALQPNSVYCDYEFALFHSISLAFPGVVICGCLFHLTRNFRSKLSEMQLIQRYNIDGAFAVDARMIVALAFVPLHAVDAAFDALQRHLNDVYRNGDFIGVLGWFEQYYLGMANDGNGRRPPMFPREMWNVFDRTVNGDPRTNNFAEAFHKSMQVVFDVQHPSVWRFIDGIRTVQKTKDVTYEAMIRGDAPPKKRRAYVQADMRLQQLAANFNNMPILNYLRGVAHNHVVDL